jgi:hypothetical protein
MLILFVALSVAASVLAWLSHPILPRHGQPLSLWAVAFTAFAAWRVSRGSAIWHVILLFETAGPYLVMTLAVARNWNLAVAGLVVICAVQVMILVSPQVIDRVGGDLTPERDSGWIGLVTIARRPPAWLLACGALIGVLVTLAFLGNMGFSTIPGCGPASSDACSVLAEGYPLRWLTATQNVPVIDKGALFKDGAQWILTSCSVLYAVWLWFRLRREAGVAG